MSFEGVSFIFRLADNEPKVGDHVIVMRSCPKCEKHKQFLEGLHGFGVTVATGDRKQHNSLRSLFRYQRLWLPLVHKHSNEDLIPPPDVAWLWHCHRLSPLNYINFIKGTFGGGATVEAKPPFSFQIPDSPSDDSSTETATRDFWSGMYPNEPFFLSETQEESSPPTLAASPNDVRGKDVNLLCGFDLLASKKRQATFLWQISGERFRDDDFLAEGVQNYIMFLKLKPKAGKSRTVLVPTYQIDLMWHTHILSSIGNYNKDCIAIMGRILHHDDSLTDRSDGGVLDVAYKATAHLWKEEYHSEYVVCGGMYRGEPSDDFFSKNWKNTQGVSAGANLHLVGLVGASSTLPPATWASPGGTTSDGRPAFIRVIASRKSELSRCAKKHKYVLGKTSYGTGYFHLETKEAHQLLLMRADRKIRELESEIARAQGCCPREPAWIQAQEAKLRALNQARSVIARRMAAARPGGNVVERSSDSNLYNTPDGAWLYPPALFDSAGGACGGAVTCGPSACGGSACAGMFRDFTTTRIF